MSESHTRVRADLSSPTPHNPASRRATDVDTPIPDPSQHQHPTTTSAILIRSVTVQFMCWLLIIEPTVNFQGSRLGLRLVCKLR